MTHHLTVSVNDKLWKEMQTHPEIRWGIIMKEAAERRLHALKTLKKLEGKMSEDEIERFAVELGRKINA